MTIAIDLDNTWTSAPHMWFGIRSRIEYEGHKVIMVTARHHPISEHERRRYLLPADLPIIYTSGELKEPAARAAGYKVDIWIDDAPGMIQECAILRPAPDAAL